MRMLRRILVCCSLLLAATALSQTKTGGGGSGGGVSLSGNNTLTGPLSVPQAFSCAVLDTAVCTGAVDANGNPNYLSAGSGATVNVNGGTTPLTYYLAGYYQQINANLTVTGATPGAETLNYILAKLDTAAANPVSADLVITNCPPTYAYVKPAACGTVSGSNLQFWFDTSTNLMKSSTDGSAYTSNAAIVLGAAAISLTPTVDSVLAQPFRLSPYQILRDFGTAADGTVTVSSGTTTKDGILQLNALQVTGGTLTHTASSTNTSTPGLFVKAQNPTIIWNGLLSANTKGAVAPAVGTGTGAAGANGGLGGAGGGGGGSGATSAAGGAGGAKGKQLIESATTGAGTAGAATPTAGGAGAAALNGLTANYPFVADYLPGCSGGAGGNGAGDATNNGGQGGFGGGYIGLKAPAIAFAGSASTCGTSLGCIQANGGNGANGAAGNAAGGGAGGGGCSEVIAYYANNVTASTQSASSGTVGAAVGTGTAGGLGGAGVTLNIRLQ